MEHVFIVNPVAGKADARNFLLPELERAKQALGAEATVECTTRPGEARDIARRWAQTGAPVRLYACGGDGTLNEVFAGALGFANAQVASVPCGSGNDFIRTFGQSARFLDIAAQMTGRAVPVDLIEANGGEPLYPPPAVLRRLYGLPAFHCAARAAPAGQAPARYGGRQDV